MRESNIYDVEEQFMGNCHSHDLLHHPSPDSEVEVLINPNRLEEIKRLQEQGIAKAKLKSRKERKLRLNIEHTAKSKEISRRKNSIREFVEPTVGEMDAYARRLEREANGEQTRGTKGMHPNKARKLRQKESNNRKKDEVKQFREVAKASRESKKQHSSLKKAGGLDIPICQAGNVPKVYSFSGEPQVWDEMKYGPIPKPDGFLDRLNHNFRIVQDKHMNKLPKFVDYLSSRLKKLVRAENRIYVELGSLTVYIYQLYSGKDAIDYISATYQFACTLPITISMKAIESIQALVEEMCHLFGVFRDKIWSFIPTTQSWVDDAASIKNFFSQVIHGELVQAIIKIVLSITSFKWFSSDVAKHIYQLLGKPVKMSLLEMCELLWDLLLKLLKYGEMLVQGVPFTDIIMSKDPIVSCSDELRELVYFGDKLYPGLPVEGRISVTEFMCRSDSALKTAEYIISKSRAWETRIINLRMLVYDLQRLRGQAMNAYSKGMRITPFAIMVTSTPGVGKSTFLNLTYDTFCHVKGIRFDPGLVFSWVAASDYMEGYVPGSHLIIHASEPGNKHRNIVSRTGDKRIDELCSVIDGQPFSANIAGLEGKGKTFVDSQLVVLDTNNPGLNLDVLCSNKAAIMRRLITVELVVKPEFRKDDGTALDSTKALAFEGNKMDLWFITVSTHTPVDNSRYHTKIILDKGNVVDYCLLMKGLMEKHIRDQEGVLDMVKTANSFEAVTGLRNEEEDLAQVQSSELNKIYEHHKERMEMQNISFRYLLATPPAIIKQYWYKCLYKFMSLFYGFYGLWFMALAKTSWLFTKQVGNLFLCSCLVLTSLLATEDALDNYNFSSFETCIYVGLSVTSLYVDRAFLFIPILCLIYYFARKSMLYNVYRAYVKRGQARKLLRESWNELLHIIGVDFDMPSFFSRLYNQHQSEIEAIVGYLSLMTLCYGVIKYSNRKSKTVGNVVNETPQVFLDEQANTHFTNENKTLVSTFNKMEDKLGCEFLGEKRKINNSELWNLQVEVPIQPTYTGDLMQFLKNVNGNVRKVIVRTHSRDSEQHIFGVCENYALINTHVLGLISNGIRIEILPNGGSVDSCKTVLITELDKFNRLDLGGDVTLIRLGNVRFVDLRKFFRREVVVYDRFDGAIGDKKVKVRVLQNQNMQGPDGIIHMKQLYVYNYENTYKGMCGIPLVASRGAGAEIVGFHCAGMPSQDKGYSAIFHILDIERAIKELNQLCPALFVASQSYELPKMEAPLVKSPVFYIPLHGSRYYGKLPRKTMIRNISRVTKTAIARKALELLYDSRGIAPKKTYGPPLMQPVGSGETYINPWNIGLSNMNNQVGYLPPQLMNTVVDRFTKHIIDNLVERFPHIQLHPITMHEAINGSNVNDYLNRIKVQTAGGYGYPGKKSKYLPVVAEDFNSLTREAQTDLIDEVHRKMDCYMRGIGCGIVYDAALKDEPRDIEKVVLGKTRLFYPTPLDSLIISKMLLGNFYSIMIENCDIFGGCVGINMHKDADKLAREMLTFSPYIIDGDFKNYDISMLSEITKCCNRVIYNVHESLGYNECALRALATYLSDEATPLVCVNNDVFELDGKTMSGSLGTAEKNTMKLVLILMLAWYSMPKTQDLDFFEHVLNRHYGDDANASVKEEVIEDFNCIVIHEFCKQVLGLTFTPADKTGKFYKYTNVDNLVFLRRRFKYDERLDRYMAPLDYDSIVKMVTWTIPSNSIPPDEQLASSMNSAIWELALHLDKNEHQLIVEKLRKIFLQVYPDYDLRTFTYDYIIRSMIGDTESQFTSESSLQEATA